MAMGIARKVFADQSRTLQATGALRPDTRTLERNVDLTDRLEDAARMTTPGRHCEFDSARS